ncbi:hypothetical protein K7B09_12570 [Thermomonas sp. RSS23]|uniref:Uncharacterized protein n=1 Tax=Thermomonas beijingensis TaxID=2872701 RepID=A0ABS7THD3_9GAMM|nr:hypothetical protein [Thermomonas beijingensis]MBZ4187155.1 hypothetical protein [Thermomonas beijingensis]
MRRIIAVSVLIFATGLAIAAASWQARSSTLKNGTVRTLLAGWDLIHYPDTKAEMLIIGKNDTPLTLVTDDPDRVEIEAIGPNTSVTLKDNNHDRQYDEIYGLEDGTVLWLDGGSYTLKSSDGKWSLILSQ